MKIKRFRRKCVIFSIAFILAGALITTAGFGVVGFNYNHLKENAIDDAWYHTIHISNDNFWYGIGLGNNIYLLSIGNAE
jgi:hypothetical protein